MTTPPGSSSPYRQSAVLGHAEARARLLESMRNGVALTASAIGSRVAIPASAVTEFFVSAEYATDLGRHGVNIEGVRIDGQIDLSFVTSNYPLQLVACTFDTLTLRYASLRFLRLERSRFALLDATRATLGGDLTLTGTKVDGRVVLDGARVGGRLELSHAELSNPSGTCFSADSVVVDGDVRADDGLKTLGVLDFSSALVAGMVDLSGANLVNPGAHTLRAPQARFESDLVLRDSFTSHGEIDLQGSAIRGQLRMGAATLTNDGGDALSADSATITRGVFLNDSFTAVGGVRFLGTRIGQFQANGATFRHDGEALNLDEAECSGGMFLDNITVEGNVQMIGLKVEGQINLTGARFDGESLSLFMDHVEVEGELLMGDIVGDNLKVLLRYARAEGQLTLINSHLGRGLDVSDAQLHGGMSLRDAILRGTVRFNDTQLGSTVTLEGCRRGPAEPLVPAQGGPAQLQAHAPAAPVQTAPVQTLNLRGAHFARNTRVTFSDDLKFDEVVVQSPVTLSPVKGQPAALTSLVGATLQAPLVVGDGISLGRCELGNTLGLDNLHIVAANPAWQTYRGRRILADEKALRDKPDADVAVRARGVETTYRQLRAALEASRAAPSAADFYYGEMEMRRLASPRPSAERVLLATYKITSGYGLRIWRAVLSYATVVLLIAAALRWRTTWFVIDENTAAGVTPGTKGLTFDSYTEVVAIVARTAGGFLSPVPPGLTPAGTALMLVARLAVPAFLALAILATRARVQR